MGTVENTSMCQVTSQCPGIHVGPRFPCVSGALGSLRGEKTHGNTGARFVETIVPRKVFFGRMSNNEVGRRSENRTDYFGNREGVSCCRGRVCSGHHDTARTEKKESREQILLIHIIMLLLIVVATIFFTFWDTRNEFAACW